jgi:hypothetical protein
MGLLIAKKEEVVIVMTDYQQDTNTIPGADKLLMAQIDAGDTRIAIDFSKMD